MQVILIYMNTIEMKPFKVTETHYLQANLCTFPQRQILKGWSLTPRFCYKDLEFHIMD
jgi:hypothetical protein